MSYKNLGVKTTYKQDYGSYSENKEFTIYCAVESVSDVVTYKMVDNEGVEHDILISSEYDCSDYGNRSLIDVLYYLKKGQNRTYSCKDYDIKIEDMTYEEMDKIFG